MDEAKTADSYAPWTDLSDGRNKKNITENMIGLGFIAQEVEAAAKKIGYNFSGVDAPKNAEDFTVCGTQRL